MLEENEMFISFQYIRYLIIFIFKIFIYLSEL